MRRSGIAAVCFIFMLVCVASSINAYGWSKRWGCRLEPAGPGFSTCTDNVSIKMSKKLRVKNNNPYCGCEVSVRGGHHKKNKLLRKNVVMPPNGTIFLWFVKPAREAIMKCKCTRKEARKRPRIKGQMWGHK